MYSLFETYLTEWKLIPDGEVITTPSSCLLPVRYQQQPAMLKIAKVQEEQRGGLLMSYWKGRGAANVFAQAGPALLLERITSHTTLVEMASRGEDDQASRIICAVAAILHTPSPEPLPTLVPLEQWFAALEPIASIQGGWMKLASSTAQALLNKPQEVGVLHGDLHHGNILDAGARGWVAIDPKGLWGERTFDFANLFCNPNTEIATRKGRLERQVEIVSQAAGLDRMRLLQWVLAWTGLSAAWQLAGGEEATQAHVVGQVAATELAK